LRPLSPTVLFNFDHFSRFFQDALRHPALECLASAGARGELVRSLREQCL
jgi:hypothetical protein